MSDLTGTGPVTFSGRGEAATRQAAPRPENYQAHRPLRPTDRNIRQRYTRGARSRATLVNGLPCREYQGTLNKSGYARLTLGDKVTMLHRWVVEQAEGVPLKPWPEEVVMHLCDNPPCFLYAHLRRARQSDNIQDMTDKGRKVQVRGTDSPHAKLTNAQVAAVRNRRTTGMTFQAIADQFGVSKTLVRKIVSGEHRPEVATCPQAGRFRGGRS